MKKYIILIIVITVSHKCFSQFATFDAANAKLQLQNVGNTIQILKNTKDQIELAKRELKKVTDLAIDAKKTMELLQAVADDRVDLSIISDLKIGNAKDFLNKVLCIDPNDFVPNNKAYLKIIASFKTGIGECSNYKNYINTYSGMEFKLAEGYYGDAFGIGGKMEDLRRDEQEAEQHARTFAIVNDRTKLEIGYKYLDISEELQKKTEELSKALDSEDFKISKAERLQFKLACTDYQLKSLDYKLKGMDLINEANRYSEEKKKIIEAQKNRIALNQWVKYSQ